jgi:hypothetical protein
MLRALCEEWADASTVIGLWAFALPGRTKNEVLSMKLIDPWTKLEDNRAHFCPTGTVGVRSRQDLGRYLSPNSRFGSAPTAMQMGGICQGRVMHCSGSLRIHNENIRLKNLV